MDPRERLTTTALLLTMLTSSVACAPGDDAPDPTTGGLSDSSDWSEKSATENGLNAINGLTSENGLVSQNGLAATNGLSVTNGLKITNGLTTINGLATVNGFATQNGKYVNCFGRADSECVAPDGLLSRRTGLMKDAEAVTTARYLVRCALRSDQAIRIPDYTDTYVTMYGELGVAPEWEAGSCSEACEEKVSACMLALLNQNGVHRRIVLTGGWQGNPLGTSHTGFNVVESAFFGNIFRSPVQAYVVSGYDHAQGVTDVEVGKRISRGLALRSCSKAGSNAKTVSSFLGAMPGCSVTHVGSFAPRENSWSALRSDPTKYDKCSYATTDAGWGGVPSRSTALECSGPGTSERTWRFPITSWREFEPWFEQCATERPRMVRVPERETAQLTCPSGQTITNVLFASYGTPSAGTCEGFVMQGCHAATSMDTVKQACLGQASCSLDASNGVFGDPCPGTRKALAVQYVCEAPLSPGLERAHYSGAFNVLPDFRALSPDAHDVADQVTLGQYANTEQFALVFTGYIQIATAGTHEFQLGSDDGSRLFIDGQLIVNNDGVHGYRTVVGGVGLTTGLHEIRVEYFERTRGDLLSLAYRTTGGSFVAVPSAMLLHRTTTN